jgi:hypothetical protein
MRKKFTYRDFEFNMDLELFTKQEKHAKSHTIVVTQVITAERPQIEDVSNYTFTIMDERIQDDLRHVERSLEIKVDRFLDTAWSAKTFRTLGFKDHES